jgi:hypothetical protein
MKINLAFARIAILGVLMVTLTVCALAQSEALPAAESLEAFAPQPVERLFDFSMFGATRGQTARLNAVFNVAPELRGRMTGARIEVELIFLDAKGNLLKQSVETLAPREGSSLELNIDSLAGGGNRFDLIPCIRVLVGADIHVPIQVIGSVELVDNATGKTVLVMEPNDWGVVNLSSKRPSSRRQTR